MRFGSLFSGIGGLDLGLERAGMHCVFQCENNPYCRKVLNKHWKVPCYGDVKEIQKKDHEIDMLCGGFPCQPHSLAGKRKGKNDERNLWPDCIRLVRLYRPDWCLFENVPGILTTMFGQVCDDLQGENYQVWTLVLGAGDIGAPHRRKRVWIMAHSKLSSTARQPYICGKIMDKEEQKMDGPGRCSTNVCHSKQSRLAKRKSIQENNEEKQSSIERTGVLVNTRRDDWDRQEWESRGRRRIQQTSWPSGPGQPQHEWEAPRRISSQSCLGNSIDGIPRRMAGYRREQLKALGNAVVPQVAEIVGRAIMAARRMQ